MTITDRTALRAILAISAAAIAFLFWLIYGYQPLDSTVGSRFAFLPTFNAACNTVSTCCLIGGFFAIRSCRIRLHGTLMASAFAASSLFLIGYLLHHSLHGDTIFNGLGVIRTLYFLILISHIILSVVALPLVLCTLWFAARRNWPRHRALARWTLPIWLYVSVTGVIIYVFLRHLNPHS